MHHVTIELWLWLGKELKDGFRSPSVTRSVREEFVEEGTNIREFLHSLAGRYEPIRRQVFDVEKRELRPEVVGTYNERLLRADEFYEQSLREGDKVIIMQMYTGG